MTAMIRDGRVKSFQGQTLNKKSIRSKNPLVLASRTYLRRNVTAEYKIAIKIDRDR